MSKEASTLSEHEAKSANKLQKISETEHQSAEKEQNLSKRAGPQPNTHWPEEVSHPERSGEFVLDVCNDL